MTVFHFDFTQDATRGSILAQVNAALGEEGAHRVQQAVEQAGLPSKDFVHPADIYAAIDGLGASDKVKADARAIYEELTRAEAKVHEKAIDQVHFHEVGRAKGVRNVIAICLAMEALGADKVTATPVQPGAGTVMCAHGEMPCPAPATAVILDSGVPTCEERLEGERVTPTSAAMIKHFVDEFEGEGAQRTYFQGPVPERPDGHHRHHHHDHDHDHGHGHDHEHHH